MKRSARYINLRTHFIVGLCGVCWTLEALSSVTALVYSYKYTKSVLMTLNTGDRNGISGRESGRARV